MTRYARGKSTHQRVAKDSTSWEELKATPIKSKLSTRKIKGFKNDQLNKTKQSEYLESRAEVPREKNLEIPTPSSSEVIDSTTVAPNVKSKKTKNGKDRKNSNVKGFGNSKVVKIFGQFWVPADDANRFQKLVTTLKEKGLSRKEISASLQSERRRAEKAGKRIRDKTCFSCRQFGHILSDCPKLNSKNPTSSVENSTEICFKCGSTEHTSRRCRRQEDKFDFAKCFICSKTGHISRQCPENKRGIYPSGGSCNECGEFTHLAKDCQKLYSSESVQTSKVQTYDSDLPSTSRITNPFASTEYEEDAGDMSKYSFNEKNLPKKKRIKFNK